MMVDLGTFEVDQINSVEIYNRGNLVATVDVSKYILGENKELVTLDNFQYEYLRNLEPNSTYSDYYHGTVENSAEIYKSPTNDYTLTIVSGNGTDRLVGYSKGGTVLLEVNYTTSNEVRLRKVFYLEVNYRGEFVNFFYHKYRSTSHEEDVISIPSCGSYGSLLYKYFILGLVKPHDVAEIQGIFCNTGDGESILLGIPIQYSKRSLPINNYFPEGALKLGDSNRNYLETDVDRYSNPYKDLTLRDLTLE